MSGVKAGAWQTRSSVSAAGRAGLVAAMDEWLVRNAVRPTHLGIALGTPEYVRVLRGTRYLTQKFCQKMADFLAAHPDGLTAEQQAKVRDYYRRHGMLDGRTPHRIPPTEIRMPEEEIRLRRETAEAERAAHEQKWLEAEARRYNLPRPAGRPLSEMMA